MKKKTVFMAACLFASTTVFAQTSNDSISYDVTLTDVFVKSSLPKEFFPSSIPMAHSFGLYMPAGKRQNMSTKSSGAVNISIYKEWMNGKLSCLLEATDLFHTQKESFTLYLSKTKEYSSSSSNTRGVSLTLRYSLNGKSTKYKGTGAGEEELRRL